MGGSVSAAEGRESSAFRFLQSTNGLLTRS